MSWVILISICDFWGIKADWGIFLIWIPAIFGTRTQNIKNSSRLCWDSLPGTWSWTKHATEPQLEQIWLDRSGFGNKTSSPNCPFGCCAHGRSYASERDLPSPWNTDRANTSSDFSGRKLRHSKQEMICLREPNMLVSKAFIRVPSNTKTFKDTCSVSMLVDIVTTFSLLSEY